MSKGIDVMEHNGCTCMCCTGGKEEKGDKEPLCQAEILDFIVGDGKPPEVLEQRR